VSPEYRGKIIIHLKPDINDPAGIAIMGGLTQLGFAVEKVRLNKYLEVTVESPHIEAARQIINAIANHEANPVMEVYTTEVSRIRSKGKH